MGAETIDKAAGVSPTENTAEERRAAARLVLRHARSREDLRELLDALGLDNPSQKGDA
jgi:hypothetical protein